MKLKRVYIGGWFQRTTLHLTEVWDFLKYGSSRLEFSAGDLARLRTPLEIATVTRESGPLEYLLVTSRSGIVFRVYEDGLIILERPVSDFAADLEAVRTYYDERLSPALSLLFSKGAPVPKELASIKTILPYIVTVEGGKKPDIARLFAGLDEEVYAELVSKQVQVYRASGLIVINNLKDESLAREVIESQIFFREFKTQLHRYLAIHRTVWGKIARINEQRDIRGSDIDALRGELAGYEKTITLIEARIEQMGTYIRTRQKITSAAHIDNYLKPLFEFKFETLQDTHEYITHLWDMTKNYLKSAIEVMNELQAKSTKSTISSLQLITTVGVVAAILGYLGRSELPRFTGVGLFYFVLLLVLTWLVNTIVSRAYKQKRYPIKGARIIKDIK